MSTTETAGPTEDMVDVLVCYDKPGFDLAVSMLQEAGIENLTRDRSSSPFPTSTGTGGERIVAVPAHAADKARALLEEAIAANALGTDIALLDAKS